MVNLSSDPSALDRIIDVVRPPQMRLSCHLQLLILSKMIDAAKGARSDDTGGLKMKAVLYIPVNPKKDVCMPPIANEKSKSDRGFNHPMTSRLLCPQKMLHEFDADPRYAININPTSPS
jgi:hypothetical protein